MHEPGDRNAMRWCLAQLRLSHDMAYDAGEEQPGSWPGTARQDRQTLGYESENGFSTALRRVVACSPRRYGRAEANDLNIV